MPRRTMPWLYSHAGVIVMFCGSGQRAITALAKRTASDDEASMPAPPPAPPVPAPAAPPAPVTAPPEPVLPAAPPPVPVAPPLPVTAPPESVLPPLEGSGAPPVPVLASALAPPLPSGGGWLLPLEQANAAH